tara:strand:+ start:414 stop:596 length:183 start_codon:yes stop_codon:yes gene_type:complete
LKSLGILRNSRMQIECALGLYQEEEEDEIEFSNQCLGTCGSYVVDIVHIPRSEEDNLMEN